VTKWYIGRILQLEDMNGGSSTFQCKIVRDMNYQCRIHEVVSTKQEVRGKIMDRICIELVLLRKP
jgi:hypothetical protein